MDYRIRETDSDVPGNIKLSLVKLIRNITLRLEEGSLAELRQTLSHTSLTLFSYDVPVTRTKPPQEHQKPLQVNSRFLQNVQTAIPRTRRQQVEMNVKKQKKEIHRRKVNKPSCKKIVYLSLLPSNQIVITRVNMTGRPNSQSLWKCS